MANPFSEYLNTHYNPSMNAIGLWLDTQEHERETFRAQLEDLLRKQAAARAAQEQAALLAKQQQAANIQILDPVLTAPVPQAKEDPGFMDYLVGRGLPGLGVAARQIAGLGADLLGDKEAAQSFYDAAAARQAVIDEEMPRVTPSLDYVKDWDTFKQWVKETGGELLPQSIIPGGLGVLGTSAAARTLATAGANLLGRELSKQTLRNIGAKAAVGGVFGSSAAMEGGQAWGTDVREHGIEGTSPRQDLLTGAGAGLLETLSPTGRVTSALFGGGPRRALNENIIKAFAKGTVLGAGKESATEAGQEFLHLLNEATQDYSTTPEVLKDILSPEGYARVREAAAAGALFGPFGGVERMLSRRAPYQEAPTVATPEERLAQELSQPQESVTSVDAISLLRNSNRYEVPNMVNLNEYSDESFPGDLRRYEQVMGAPLIDFLGNVPETIEERARRSKDTIDTWYNDALASLDRNTSEQIAELDKQIEAAQQVLVEAKNPNSQGMQQYTVEQREILGRKAENTLTRLQAKKVKIQEDSKKALDDLNAQYDKKLNSVTDTTVKDMLSLERNDMSLPEMTEDAQQRANYGIRAKRFRETFQKVYTDILQENAARINEISNKLRNLTVGNQSVIRSMYKEQLDALRKQRKELVNSIRKVGSITDKLMKKHLQLDNADYTAQDAEMDFAELSTFAEDVPDANDLVDQIAKKYLQKSYDKAKMEAIRERRAARKAERREVFNETYPMPTEETTEPVVEEIPAPEQELYNNLQKTYSEALATNNARISDMSNRLRNMTTGDHSVIRSMFEEQLKALRDERRGLIENLRKASTAAANGDIDSLNSLLQQSANLSSKAEEVTAKYLKHSFTEARTQARRAKFADRAQTYQDVISDPASMTPKQTKEEKQFRKNINTAKAAIKPIIDAMPALKGKIKVIEQANDPNLANNIGFFTPEGDIYLNLTNVIEEARRTKKGVGAIASRAIIHEAVVHYGLRAIFKQDYFNRFINLVDESFRNTRQWNQIASRIEGFDTLAPEIQAEEFLAKYAEQYDMSTLLKDGKSAWVKVMGFIKRVLRKIIPYKVTDEDVMNVLSAAAYRLSQNEAPLQTAPRSEGLARTLDPVAEQMSRTERAEAGAAQRFPFFNKLKEIYADRQDTLETFKEVVVDSFRPVQRMVEDVKKLGKKADGTPRVFWDTNIYKLNQHLSSQQSLALQQYHAKFVQPLLDLILETRLNPNEDASVTFARADDYIEAVAALERNEYGMNKGLTKPLVVAKQGQTLEQANDYFRSVKAKYQSEAMDKVMTQLQKINNERLRLLEEFKIVPKEVLDAWRGTYKVYMPFKSWENLIEEADPAWYKSSTRRSLSTPGAQRRIMARATGRDGEAQSPITHAILQLYDVSNLTKTVEVGRSLLRLVKDNPDATSIFEMVEYRDKDDKAWGRPTTYVDPETGHQVTEITHGFVKTVVDKKTGDISIKPTKHSAEGHIKDTVAVINEDGIVERVWIKDPGVARALKAENIARAGGVIRTIGTIQHTLGKYMTSRNPLFWITNPIRDTVTAAINISSLSQELRALGVQNPTQISTRILSEGLGKALTKNSVRNAIMYFRKHGTLDDVADARSGLDEATKQYMADYEAYLAYGGQTEYFGTNTYETLSKDLVSTLRDKNPVTNAQKAKASINKMMEYFDEVSGSLENMTRYIAFKEIVDALRPYADAGRTADGRPFSHEEMYSRAANVALNLTVNFSRKGAWAPIFNSLYMFASASIGGNVRMLETIFRKDRLTGKTDWGHVAKFMMFPLAAYVLQATLARAVMGDDDDGINFYDKIPEYIKSGNIIIPSPFGGGHYITIPMPYGFDMFWNLAQKTIDSIIAGTTGAPGPTALEAATSIVNKAFNNFATIGGTDEGWTSFVPTVVRPLVQLANNKNFAGNPIMPTGNENLRGNIPDHEKYWSTANQTVVELCKMMSPVLDISPESIEHLANAYLGGLGRITFGVLGRLDDLWRGNEVSIGEVPGLKVLYKTPQDSDTSALFSKYRTEALTQINAIEESKHDMGLSLEDRFNIVQENKTGYKLKKDLNKVQQKLNKIREMERKLLANSALSSSTKQEQLERLKKQKQQFMKLFISQANRAGL